MCVCVCVCVCVYVLSCTVAGEEPWGQRGIEVHVYYNDVHQINILVTKS